jgi:hypothetical protein
VVRLPDRVPRGRAVVLHSYSLEQAEREGLPGQHLWGADALRAAGWDVELGFLGARRRALGHLSWRLGGRAGDLEEEALALVRRADVVVAGEAGLVRGLAALPRRLRPPLVGVVHAPAPWVRRLDVALCLSGWVRDRVGDARNARVVPWGPDLAHPGYAGAVDEGWVMSAGKTDRDVATLLAALDGTGLRARVHAPAATPAPAGVEVVVTDPRAPHDLRGVLDAVRRCGVVAIPLARTDRLLALTELCDALALGKPVVMTRTPAIDLDVEAIGCGLLVEPGDVAGWRAALERLGRDPALRARMGAAGRTFAEAGWNSAAFGAAVVAACDAARR